MPDKTPEPRVLAHYMPWFAADPARGRWGWHWTMDAFDPQRATAAGRRPIASHFYPLIGPYDSGDPAVIEYHLLLMKLAGIDGVIVDWYGLSDLFDYAILHRNTQTLIDAAARFGLSFAICYEDQTIPKRVEAKRIEARDRVDTARRELVWLRDNWFVKPAYWKRRGKPVLLSFGYAGLTDAEWESTLRGIPEPPLYLSEHRRRPVTAAAAGAFDWPQPQIGLASLDRFDAERKPGEPFLPVAFPRFQDIYKEARVQDGFPRIPDDRGETFARTLDRALKSGAPTVQIATWNDWGEGTMIEPSVEFQYRDLERIQRLRRPKADPDDLRLPLRIWRLRRTRAEAGLEDAVRLLASGRVAEARSAITRLESRLPKLERNLP